MKLGIKTTALAGLAAAGVLVPLTGAPAQATTARTAVVQSPAVTAAAKCTIHKYKLADSELPWWYPAEEITHKGRGTKKYDYGVTRFKGRKLILRTGRKYDRSSARILSGYKKGDRVWVDISGDKGRSWQKCGSNASTRTGWFLHNYKSRWMRACMKVDGRVKCAHVGDRSYDGRKWWID